MPRAAAADEVFATISVCHPRDIATWEVVARHMPRRIAARHHRVIVPDDAVPLFRDRSPAAFDVIGESRYAAGLAELIARHAPPDATPRTGWYLQQFLKLRALEDVPSDEVAVIWDADTVPLRRLSFVAADGRLVHWKSAEHHPPYFAAIERLLGMPKAVDHSFVAQCLAVRGRWMREFIAFVERRHGRPWLEAVVASIDFREPSGFSEYETLGTFVACTHPQEMVATNRPWLRPGRRRVGTARNVDRAWASPLLAGYDFAAFESWDEPYAAWTSLLEGRVGSVARRLRRLARRLTGRPCDAEEFLARWFARPGLKTVVQVGANDGEQNDPLRRFLVRPGNYTAILVEPLPYYTAKLRNLYRGRSDVTIVEAALGAEPSSRRLHFIPPEIADEMDGDGPANRWAHGQGSFDREVVAHWIRANTFRGESYRRRLSAYLDAIASVEVPVRPAVDVMPAAAAAGDVLLVIDVQGAELDVLRGVDWSRPPRAIVVEDDLGRGAAVAEFLLDRGYRHECGDHDKVFVRAWRPA
jgi:FkbM family methyltransferase